MAPLIYELLTKGERAALPFLESAARQGLSYGEAERQLKAAGMGIRRTNGLALYRALKDQTVSRDYVSSVKLGATLNPERFGKALTKTIAQYTYRIRSVGVSLLTGERTTQYVSVISDTLLTKQQALDTAQAIVESSADKYAHVSGDLQVDEVLTSQ